MTSYIFIRFKNIFLKNTSLLRKQFYNQCKDITYLIHLMAILCMHIINVYLRGLLIEVADKSLGVDPGAPAGPEAARLLLSDLNMVVL